MSLGIQPLEAPGATGSYDTDVASKAETVRAPAWQCWWCSLFCAWEGGYASLGMHAIRVCHVCMHVCGFVCGAVTRGMCVLRAQLGTDCVPRTGGASCKTAPGTSLATHPPEPRPSSKRTHPRRRSSFKAVGALVSGGYDFALLHVKAVDDTGHDRMAAMKVGGQKPFALVGFARGETKQGHMWAYRVTPWGPIHAPTHPTPIPR